MTYADNTTFFLSRKNSVTEVIQIFEHFLIFPGLKPNCKIADNWCSKRDPNGTLWCRMCKPKN